MIVDLTEKLDSIGNNISNKSPIIIPDLTNTIVNDVLNDCEKIEILL